VDLLTRLLDAADLLTPNVEVIEQKADDTSKGTDPPRTVDSFQGLEADFVILCTVHSPPRRAGAAPPADDAQREDEWWPWSLRNGRLCVAATRAKMQFNWIANFDDIVEFPKLQAAFERMNVHPVRVVFPDDTGEPLFEFPDVVEELD